MGGFVSAQVMVEGLLRAGRSLDREAFVRAPESSNEFDLGSCTGRFSDRDHNGSSHVEPLVPGISKRVMR